MKTIIDSFLETAEKFPENKAVSDEQGSITYQELDELSDLTAQKILSLPAGKVNGNIGVVYPRRKEVLVGLLGVLRSGNCYVFVAPDSPESRMRFILEDADISCLITSKAVECIKGNVYHANGREIPIIYLEDILEQHKNAAEYHHNNLSDGAKAAFMTYTSGSTGNPKGVVDTYYYIQNHIRARHHYYQPLPDECIGNIVSFTYAASTYDLFSGLMVGCNLYIFSDEELLNQSLLVSRIIAQNISTMFMIPSMIPVVFMPGAELPIKCIITAGEKAKQIPEISARMVEIYGSSEAAAVLGREAKTSDPWNLLGTPMEGTTIYLLDEEGKLIESSGTVGEVCIVNDALALEYRNREEETRAKFVDCPFCPGKRMYKSGDLMQFDEAGNYYYCGRKDNMTKINGQRVEMGEIEATIVKHPGVADAVCAIRQSNQKSVLICYYIQEKEEKEVSANELTDFTKKRLPGYMVPLYWFKLEKFPKNVNGKVDRKALPDPDFSIFSENVEAETYEERQLLKTARALLPDVPFGVTDDLMRLGMDSIRAVQFVSEIEKFDKRITVSDVMKKKNIRAILSEKKEMIWFQEQYDEQKPVLVLVHGLVPVSAFSTLYETWGKFFNLLVIEPFLDHIYEVLDQYDYEKLIQFYMEQISLKLGDIKNLWGFAGFSFGGQIAVSLADAWQKKTGDWTHVFMGDTLIQWIYPGKVFPVLTEDDPYIKMVVGRSKKYGDSVVREPIDLIIKKQNAVIDLMRTMSGNTKYDGPVLYLDAKMDYDESTEALKLSVVRGLFKNATIIEFKDYFHNDLYMKQEIFVFYENYFRMMMKKENGSNE